MTNKLPAAIAEAPQLGGEELLIEPRDKNFALLPIDEGFDWVDIAEKIHLSGKAPGVDEYYLVVFRSKQLANADVELLEEADRKAYEEALSSTGLLHYFRGVADEDGNNVSFCLWTSPEEAKLAASRPVHTASASLASSMYRPHHIERYMVGTDGSLTPYTRPKLGAATLKEIA